MSPVPRLKVVAFGASGTQQGAFPFGWLTLLSSHYQRRADVFNRGYSGYTSRNAVTLLRRHLDAGIWPYDPTPPPSHSPSPHPFPRFLHLVLLSLGSNDSCLRYSTPPWLHVPLPAYLRNLRRIIGLLVPEYGDLSTPPSHYPSTRTALILLTPLDDSHWLAYRRHKYHQPAPDPSLPQPPSPYTDAVRALAAEYHIPLCDLAALMLPDEVTTAATWTWDGCHLNAEGSARLFTRLLHTIAAAYPSLRADALPMDGPPFDAWDTSDPTSVPPWPLPPHPPTPSSDPSSTARSACASDSSASSNGG